MAVAAYVAEAQIDFLLQQTLHEIEESRKDKVTTKAGMRRNEIWKEITTAGRQIVLVGLLNVALRLSQAKPKLAGVDVSGRTQREAVIAEERQRREARDRGQESGVRGQEIDVGGQRSEVRRDEETKVKKPLMKKNEKSEVAAETVQPQVKAVHEDKLRGEKEEFVRNAACKQLINHLGSDPQCAGWTDEQIREHAQLIWDTQQEDAAVAAKLAWSQRGNPHPGPLPRGEGEERGDFPKGDILPVSGVTTKGQHESRHRQDKRNSAEERRREFLAPLAAG